VVMHNVVSVDGFIADGNDDVGPLFEWYFNGALPGSPLRSHGRHASAAGRGLRAEVQRLVFGVLAQKGVCLALDAGTRLLPKHAPGHGGGSRP